MPRAIQFRARGAATTKPAALGARAHSGWAAVVALAGSARSPELVDRRRIVNADPAIRGSKQPYHAVEMLPLKQAEDYLKRCAARTRTMTRQAFRAALKDLALKGHCVERCGVLLGSGKPLPGLSTILASHPLLHTAEGEFYRDAIRDAGEHCGLKVTGVKEREVYERAAAMLRASPQLLQRRLDEMGKRIGPPWRQDEKLAALVAWLALAGARSSRSKFR
jgi:hypothetical protein